MALALGAWGQPPLPPSARARDVGVVLDVKPGESIRLETGVRAVIGQDAKVSGADGRVLQGDLIELAYGADGAISEIEVLPRREQQQPLTELRLEQGAVRQAFWQYEGEVYPNSLRTAGARFRLSTTAAQLVGHAAYDVADPAQPPATFRVLDQSSNMLWEGQVGPGQVTALRCGIRRASRLQLKCVGPNDEPLSDQTCLWLSPRLVLRQMEYVALRPELSTRLIRELRERLGQFDAGTVAVGMPQVIGLAAETGRDLRDDLLVSAAAAFPVVGALPSTTGWLPSDKDRAAAEALGATSILATRVQWEGAKTRIRARLLTVAHNEELTAAEAAVD
jgi:hypothetical protein